MKRTMQQTFGDEERHHKNQKKKSGVDSNAQGEIDQEYATTSAAAAAPLPEQKKA